MKHPKDSHRPMKAGADGAGGGVPPEKNKFKRDDPPQTSAAFPLQGSSQSDWSVARTPPFSMKLSQSKEA